MTPDEFRDYLDHFELTLDDFAWLVGYDRKTVTSWGKPRNRRGIQMFPRWVPLLFDAWDLCGGPPRQHPWDDITQCELRITPKEQ
jgi:hypothetical protein